MPGRFGSGYRSISFEPMRSISPGGMTLPLNGYRKNPPSGRETWDIGSKIFCGACEKLPVLLAGAKRTTKRTAELIHSEGRLQLIEEVAGVESRVPGEFKEIAVILARSGFDDEVDGSGAAVSVTCVRGRRFHTEFLHCIDRRIHHHTQAYVVFVVADAIDEKLILFGAQTIDRVTGF